MEITFYYYNQFDSKEESEEFLLYQLENVTGSKNEFIYKKQEESEEGEGDTLYVKCDFFSFTTTLFDVKNVSRDYDVGINYGLECNIFENGNKKFMEFIGNLLKSTIGDALLLKDYEYRVLERKNNCLIVDSHFFYGDYESLSLSYIQGMYKKICLRIEGDFITEEIKRESIKLVAAYENEDKVEMVEDPDYPLEFTINWGRLQIHISNLGTVINLTCGHIFTSNDKLSLKRILCFFKQITTKFSGDYQLMIVQGYWEQKRSVLLERKNGIIAVNELAEEAYLIQESDRKN